MRSPIILPNMPESSNRTGPLEPFISSEIPLSERQMYTEDQISAVLDKLAPQLSSPNNIIFNRVLVCPVNEGEISNERLLDERYERNSSKTNYNSLIEHLSVFPATVSTVALINGHYILCTATYTNTGIENLTITDSSRSAEPHTSRYPALFSEHSPFYGLAPDKVTFSPQLYQRQGSTDCGPLSICNLLIKNGVVPSTDFGNSYIDTAFLREGYNFAASLEDGEQIKDALGGVISGMSDHSHPFLDHKYDQVVYYCEVMGMPHAARVLSEIILPHNPGIDPLALAIGLQEYFHWAEPPANFNITSSVSDNHASLFSDRHSNLAHVPTREEALGALPTDTVTNPQEAKKEEIIITLTAFGIDDLSTNELEILSVINEHSDKLIEELANIREITSSNPDIDQDELAARLLDMRSSGSSPR